MGLVLPGGGARTAYQVGVLSALVELFPHARFPLVTGVSGGAINAAFLACHADSFLNAVSRLEALWHDLEFEHVFKTGALDIVGAVTRWGAQLTSGGNLSSSARGFVDTSPLRSVIESFMPEGQESVVGRHLAAGHLSAFAVTATNYQTWQSETFIEGDIPYPWERPYRRSVESKVTAAHVMASAAIPFLFPAVDLNGTWYGDGGIRQTAPLSPALHLGAERILAVSTLRTPSARPKASIETQSYPSFARIAGLLVNAMFLDNVDFDAANMMRINSLLERRQRERTEPGTRRVEVLVLRPSDDLGKLARDYEQRLPRAFRYMSRGWGGAAGEPMDLSATLLFDGAFTRRLIDLGRQDALAQRDVIGAFLGSGDADSA